MIVQIKYSICSIYLEVIVLINLGYKVLSIAEVNYKNGDAK